MAEEKTKLPKLNKIIDFFKKDVFWCSNWSVATWGRLISPWESELESSPIWWKSHLARRWCPGACKPRCSLIFWPILQQLCLHTFIFWAFVPRTANQAITNVFILPAWPWHLKSFGLSRSSSIHWKYLLTLPDIWKHLRFWFWTDTSGEDAKCFIALNSVKIHLPRMLDARNLF